ncbi:MAG: hypothetical protein J5643_05425 [Lachnospiraceae bacterium]|nr:hypothetical protein [Lachnospiraceae bacterium]
MIRKSGLCAALFFCMLLCGCGDDGRTYKVKNPLSEAEIVEYVTKAVKDETGDDVDVKIVGKEDMIITLSDGIDGCLRTDYPVEGGHTYHLEIRCKSEGNIMGTGTYEDGCTVTYKDGATRDFKPKFSSDYKKQRGLYLIRSEFERELGQYFSEYYIYKDVSNDAGYDIFLQCSDYDILERILKSFNRTVSSHRNEVYTCFSVYIYKDAEAFQKRAFTLYPNGHEDFGGQSHGGDMIEQYTGKNVTEIGGGRGFERNLFESDGASAAETDEKYEDAARFDYLIFYYDSEPNAASHNGDTRIYGVR